MSETRTGVAILGIYVVDLAFRASRLPKMGETILGPSFAMGPGGKGSNQAVAAARAGLGMAVSFITKVGRDNFMRARHPDWFREDLERLFKMLAAGVIKSRVADAHRRLEEGGLAGKVVLCPNPIAAQIERCLSQPTDHNRRRIQ